MPTFLYSPGIRVLINNLYKGQVDVTADVEQMQMTLNENNCHTISFTLSNDGGKYSNLFVPNDTIVVQMKRVQWLQIFTGYLDTVPYFSAFPRSVTFTGECTMKRIKFHWWDPGYSQTLNAIQGWIGTGEAADPTDSGLSNVISSALTQIIGWPANQIHIGTIPPAFFTQLNTLYGKVSAEINAENQAIFGGAVVAGNGGGATGDMAAFLYGERETESSGNYTSPGGGAYGFIPPYFTDTAISAGFPQYANTPAENVPPSDQDAIALWFAGQKQAKFGTWKLMAEAWYGGDGAVPNGDNYYPGGNNAGLTLGGYAARVLNFMAQYPGNATPSTPAAPTAPAPGAPSGGVTYPVAASLVLGRTDQGVDWSGSGDLYAVGPGTIIATQNSGWPGGTFIALKLDTPVTATHSVVYYAEDIDPAVSVGQHVNGGQVVGHATGGDSGIELGWADPQAIGEALAGAEGQFNGSNATPEGQDFLAYIKGAPQPAGGGTTSSSGLTTQSWQPGQPVVAWWNPAGIQPDQASQDLTGYKVLMNDTPIMPFIDECCQAGLRHYCAAPNGDFIAWFPDYFGQYGYAAQMLVSPLEIIDFTMNWSDQQMITHQFTAGAYTNFNPSLDPTQGGQQTISDMVSSQGVATIDVPGLFQALFNIDPTVEDGLFANASNIYQQFGARPQFMNMPTIASGPTTFYFAVNLWMKNWASQFSADVEVTFMPELWPGMLLVLPEFGFQAYIHSVTHNINMQEGGGFTTSVNVIAPSTYTADGSNSGLYGLARGGPIVNK